MALDLSNLSPTDVAVTMRSLPRRFREAVEVGPDEDADELARRVGPDGRSALDHVSAVGRMLALLGGALGEVVSGRRPVLHAAVTDPTQREWDHGADDLDRELGMLADEAESMAARIERTSPEQWDDVGRVTGGGEMTALDVAKEAVRTAIDGLHATESAMASARTG